MVDFQYFGLLSAIGLSQADAVQLGASHLFYTIFLNLIGFCLAAFITGYLYERARESEVALRDKTVDYEELHRLNTTIVSNVESGLLTITPQGNIRVFNRYAETVTGWSQAEVYDRPLVTVFPALVEVLEYPDTVFDREFEYEPAGRERMIIGCSSLPFTDMQGHLAGVIINLTDMTDMKRMEAALKRADRLAALGEISARMAHEIRNPLAAMCGSVQLLAEHGTREESDRRLLAIVVREADRLNSLITDFLAYARPAPPHKERIELRALCEDMCVLLASDNRFKRVRFVDLVPGHMMVRADVNQLRQVLLNLLHNAAEAMPDGGRVELEAHFQLSGAGGFNKAPVAVIAVTNSGSGLDAETAAHLFEPFWTTKPDGSGLGLATTYRIIEAHGGTIMAESPPEGGCRFTIMLPI